MPLVISDETLHAAGLSEQDARLEFACRLFDAGKLSFGHAAQLAGVDELEFERQLTARGLPRHRLTEEKLLQDVETLKRLDRW